MYYEEKLPLDCNMKIDYKKKRVYYSYTDKTFFGLFKEKNHVFLTIFFNYFLNYLSLIYIAFLLMFFFVKEPLNLFFCLISSVFFVSFIFTILTYFFKIHYFKVLIPKINENNFNRLANQRIRFFRAKDNEAKKNTLTFYNRSNLFFFESYGDFKKIKTISVKNKSFNGYVRIFGIKFYGKQWVVQFVFEKKLKNGFMKVVD